MRNPKFAPWILSLSLACSLTTICRGAEPPPAIDPRYFGLEVPAGPVRSSGDRRAVVQEDGKTVVARVHCDVGPARILLLPDGRLVTRKLADAPDTERPFEPAGKEALAEQWCARLAQDLGGKFQSKTTRHYVFVYDTSDEFVLVTSRILESMVPGMLAFAEIVKLKAQEPELPLVVLMLRTEAEFQKLQRMPPGVVAYYNQLTNHVVLYEELQVAGVKRELAIQQSLSSIAHEGAHQILHNVGIQQRLSLWPMWLSEGLAEYLAPTSFGKNLRWKGAGQVNDLRMFELEQYLKSRESGKADGQLIEHTVLAARLTSTGYATAWALTHYLAKQQKGDFQKYLQEISRLGPLEGDARIEAPGVIKSQLAGFEARFGSELTEVERRLILHLKKLPYSDPFAEWPHYVGMVSSGNNNRPRREANVFHLQEQAENWRTQTLERLSEEQRSAAKSAIQAFPNRATAETFARQWLGGR